jgi:hypothetical protein
MSQKDNVMKRTIAPLFSFVFLFFFQLLLVGCATQDTSGVALQGDAAVIADVTEGSDLPPDISTAEKPGSRAEKDHLLQGRSATAQAAYDKARANEKIITPVMQQIARELGATMVGLQYSVKTASSVEDKIQRKLKDSNGTKSDEQIVNEIGDLVRYTQMSEHNKLVANTRKTIARLEQLGYSAPKLDNRYLVPNASYKGIHLDVVSPQGQRFELQIHSPDSMAVKNATHKMYEEARNVNTTPERAKQLTDQMRAMWVNLPMPKDIETLANYKR